MRKNVEVHWHRCRHCLLSNMFFFYDRFTFKYQSTDILYNFGIYNTYQNVCVQNFLIAEDDQTIEFYWRCRLKYVLKVLCFAEYLLKNVASFLHALAYIWNVEILCTLVYRIVVHARLLILRKKSTLHGLIWVCTFIYFKKNFLPARLFHPTRLLNFSIFHCCNFFAGKTEQQMVTNWLLYFTAESILAAR